MEFEEILKRRRSVRKFTDQQVREETIVQIINESRQAPSWANAQETKIYVATKNAAKMIRKLTGSLMDIPSLEQDIRK